MHHAKQKILFVITGMGLGGAEMQLAHVSAGLVARGHDVELVYLTGPARVTVPGPKIAVSSLQMQKSLFSLIAGIYRLRRKIREFRPDVVHSHMLHANLVSRVARLLVKMPILVNTVHNVKETASSSLLMAVRLSQRLADVTTFVSKDARQAYLVRRLCSRDKTRIIYNGIDVVRFQKDPRARSSVTSELGVASEERVVLTVGRLELNKDHRNLLLAFSQVAAVHGNARLLIAGEGTLHQELESLRDRLGLQEHVRFLGSRTDVARLMSASDVFVLSSAWEGFGLVVGEAMACELMVVATDCGGVGEVLGTTGRTVKPQDTEALAAALCEALATSPDERREITGRARARVVRLYSLDHALDEWEALYAALECKAAASTQ